MRSRRRDSTAGAAGPARMPLRAHGQWRKRWRYVGVFAPEAMLCAARVEVGPFKQSFWVVWDRQRQRRLAHTSLRPGSREVRLAVSPDADAEDERLAIEARGVRAELRLGEGQPVEARCPSGSGWGWTRKRAGIAARGTLQLEGRRIELDGFAVDDQSAGYHRRETSWLWSAGVGRAADGRAVAWNLVEGINDPPRESERAIWLAGEPSEPAPVAFEGLEAIGFADGSRLRFAAECERRRDDNLLFLRSSYALRFGSFSGALEGGLSLADGLGVMESHRALW